MKYFIQNTMRSLSSWLLCSIGFFLLLNGAELKAQSGWPSVTVDTPAVGPRDSSGALPIKLDSSQPFALGGTCLNTDGTAIFVNNAKYITATYDWETHTYCEANGRWSVMIDVNRLKDDKGIFHLVVESYNQESDSYFLELTVYVVGDERRLTLESPKNLGGKRLLTEWADKTNFVKPIPIDGACVNDGDLINFTLFYKDDSGSMVKTSKPMPNKAICSNGHWNSTVYPYDALAYNQRIISLDANEINPSTGGAVAEFEGEQIELPPPDLTAAFINGVLNSPEEANNSKTLLNNVINANPDASLLNIFQEPNGASFSGVKLFYNFSTQDYKAANNAYEHARIMGKCDISGVRRSLINAVMNEGDLSAMQQCGIASDELARQVILNTLLLVNQNAAVLQSKAEKILSDPNQRLLLIGHSHGTLFTNQIYYYLSPDDEKRTAIVHIASIATRVADGYGHWTTASNDPVVEFARDKLKTILGAMPSDLSFPGGDNHFFSEYLSYSNSLKNILSDIRASVVRIVMGKLQ